MKALIFGAGQQGKVAGDYLAKQGVRVSYADINISNLEEAKRNTKSFKMIDDFDVVSSIDTIHIKNNSVDYYTEILKPFDVVFSKFASTCKRGDYP